MNKMLPQALLEKQELTRQTTINKVLRALQDLGSEGCRITIKNLMAYSGLSRSVFAKPHVRAILADYGFDAPKSKNSSKKKKDSNISVAKETLQKLEERIEILSDENAELKRECELLRGRLFLLMQSHGSSNAKE